MSEREAKIYPMGTPLEAQIAKAAVREAQRKAPSSAVPLETMIEEMGYVELYQRGDEDGGTWIASNADQYEEAPTVREAIAALYRAWRERE